MNPDLINTTVGENVLADISGHFSMTLSCPLRKQSSSPTTRQEQEAPCGPRTCAGSRASFQADGRSFHTISQRPSVQAGPWGLPPAPSGHSRGLRGEGAARKVAGERRQGKKAAGSTEGPAALPGPACAQEPHGRARGRLPVLLQQRQAEPERPGPAAGSGPSTGSRSGTAGPALWQLLAHHAGHHGLWALDPQPVRPVSCPALPSIPTPPRAFPHFPTTPLSSKSPCNLPSAPLNWK